MAPSIVWFRQDLRLQNNPALHKALEAGRPIIKVYIWNSREKPGAKAGKAGQWRLHHSLANLEQDIFKHGSRLILRSGDPKVIIQKFRHTLKQKMFGSKLLIPNFFLS